MIQLYSWATPNGHKVHILLEETGLDYQIHPINIGTGEQFSPEFLAINPNNKIPAILDEEGPGGKPFSLAESGAILLYLAEKTRRFLPAERSNYYLTLQWLMFQMGHIGPMLGQAHHFRFYAPVRQSYPIERYTQEAHRLYGILDRRLRESDYLAGPDYGVADIATFPWLRAHDTQGVSLDDYPHLRHWYAAIDARPAVQRGLAVLAQESRQRVDDTTRLENLFGNAQYRRR